MDLLGSDGHAMSPSTRVSLLFAIIVFVSVVPVTAERDPQTEPDGNVILNKRLPDFPDRGTFEGLLTKLAVPTQVYRRYRL